MPSRLTLGLLLAGIVVSVSGGADELTRARRPVPEASLLDVGIHVFDARLPDELEALRELESAGIFPDVRRAEARYIPVHLARTLQRSGFWGAVRTVPDARAVDLNVSGAILSSNGAELRVAVRVVDARGRVWLDEKYKEKAEASVGVKSDPSDDRFQGLYNEIANDIHRKRRKFDEEDVRQIRTVSRLRFAADLAPTAFADYLDVDKKSRYSVVRLPASDDPMMARVDRIRARDGTFIDTLNDYYNAFYAEMQESYAAWRSQDYWERETIRSARGSSSTGGAPMRSIGTGRGGPWGVGVGPVCVVPSDFQQLSDDSDRRTKKDAETHIAALRELGASLASDVAPLLVEVEGEVLRFTGSVEAQYASWRTLLREIFASETGLPVITRSESARP